MSLYIVLPAVFILMPCPFGHANLHLRAEVYQLSAVECDSGMETKGMVKASTVGTAGDREAL